MKNPTGEFHLSTNQILSTMKRFQHLHISEGVRNAIIVIALFGTIAIVTYIEWGGF